MDNQTGLLEVGTTGRGEIVINHPKIKPDKNGFKHIVCSPGQAIALAKLLRQETWKAHQELRGLGTPK